jgi:hypothetical protein
MNAVEAVSGACPACRDGRDHRDRVQHQPRNRLLSRRDEPQRRWDAAVEAHRLGGGGVRRGAAITGRDEQTIRRGQQAVAGARATVPLTRPRRPGGGRPPVAQGIPRS